MSSGRIGMTSPMPRMSIRTVMRMKGSAACLLCFMCCLQGAAAGGRDRNHTGTAAFSASPASTAKGWRRARADIIRAMTNWLAVAQAELGRLGLPGWLIYDFRGLNGVAQRFLKLGPGMLTRRVFLFVPAESRPVLLVHAIEAGSLDPDLPVLVRAYSSHQSLREELRGILPAGPLALEYSP